MTCATVPAHREAGRVVRVGTRVVFGALRAVAPALAASAVRRAVHACLVERHNGTDRNRCRRKARTTYGFSQDGDGHRAGTRFGHGRGNFCGPVRTLRVRGAGGGWRARTPAMAAGVADPVWSRPEWWAYPAVQRR